MKKLMLLPLTSAFFIVVAFTCEKNLETVEKEPPYTDPICESRGELRKKVKGSISWSEAVSDWVLWVNVDNPNEPGSGIRYIECVGFPVELRREGLEILCDMEVKKFPNPGAIKLAAHPMELQSYEIIRIPNGKK